MSNLFYLQDSRSNVGDGLQFWAKGGHGYVTDLDKAELFTQEQACRHRATDLPWPKEYIDARAHHGVDHQLMDEAASGALLAPGCRVYVHVPGDWNGNDVYWVGSHNGRITEHLDNAVIMTLEEARDRFVDEIGEGRRKIWSADYIDTICRRLAHRQNVDIEKALRGTGIKPPKPRRPREQVFNCHGCGRFVSDRQRFQHDCPNCGADNRP